MVSQFEARLCPAQDRAAETDIPQPGDGAPPAKIFAR